MPAVRPQSVGADGACSDWRAQAPSSIFYATRDPKPASQRPSFELSLDNHPSENQHMKVSIKDFAVSMEVKNKGIELDVYANDDTHLGDLIVTKTGLTWCKGKTTAKNGKKIAWRDFIAHMDAL
jgi:hypothetical protein